MNTQKIQDIISKVLDNEYISDILDFFIGIFTFFFIIGIVVFVSFVVGPLVFVVLRNLCSFLLDLLDPYYTFLNSI